MYLSRNKRMNRTDHVTNVALCPPAPRWCVFTLTLGPSPESASISDTPSNVDEDVDLEGSILILSYNEGNNRLLISGTRPSMSWRGRRGCQERCCSQG